MHAHRRKRPVEHVLPVPVHDIVVPTKVHPAEVARHEQSRVQLAGRLAVHVHLRRVLLDLVESRDLLLCFGDFRLECVGLDFITTARRFVFGEVERPGRKGSLRFWEDQHHVMP